MVDGWYRVSLLTVVSSPKLNALERSDLLRASFHALIIAQSMTPYQVACVL